MTLVYAQLVAERGYPTPEDAVVAGMDVPARYYTIVGSKVHGNEATVWLLTNDREPFEEYECHCIRENGQWRETGGSGGFSLLTPLSIRKHARGIRESFKGHS